MKTSNKLLIGLLIVGLITLISSTIALRTEYNKIDFNDPFYGFSSTPVKPFTVLKIEGARANNPATANALPTPTTVGIQNGKTFEIRRQKDNKLAFSYRILGDTLLIRYEPEYTAWRISTDELFDQKPFAYIIAPSIQTLIVAGTTCNVAGLTTEKLAIVETNARVHISKSTIGNLTAIGRRGSLLRTGATNHIHTAAIASHDSTAFIADRDVFASLTMQNDSLATVQVPASLLKKL